jgi:hypothetical protein
VQGPPTTTASKQSGDTSTSTSLRSAAWCAFAHCRSIAVASIGRGHRRPATRGFQPQNVSSYPLYAAGSAAGGVTATPALSVDHIFSSHPSTNGAHSWAAGAKTKAGETIQVEAHALCASRGFVLGGVP